MNKKKLIIISSIILVVIIIILGILFLFRKKNIDKVVNYGIIAMEKIDYDEFIKYGDNFLVKKDNKYGLLDKEFNEVVPLSYESFLNAINDKLFLFVKDNMSFLFDKDGNRVAYEVEISTFSCSVSDTCYYTFDGHTYNFYDGDNNKFYSSTGSGFFNVLVIDDYLVSSSNVIDLSKGEKMLIDQTFDAYCGNLYKVNGYVLYVNTCDKTIEKYDSISDYKTGQAKRKVRIEDTDYYIDYSYCDNDRGYLFKNDNLIIDSCSSYYDINLASKGVYIYDSNGVKVRFKNDKVLEFSSAWSVGDFVLTKDFSSVYTSIHIYDLDGEEVKLNCLITSYKNGKYVCEDGIKSYLLDESLEYLLSDYDDIVLKKDYAVIMKDSKYALYVNDLLTGYIFDDIVSYDDYVIGYIGDNTYYISLGFAETLIDGMSIETEQVDIDNVRLMEIIKNYELDDIENDIMNNKEFFYRYANNVLNNSDLKKYRKQVLNLFKVIVDKKSYMNEEYFLSKVKSLRIVDKEIDTPGVSGYYFFTDNEIQLEEQSERVLYHELMHFVDYNFDEMDDIYYCDGGYKILNSLDGYIYSNNEKCNIESDSRFVVLMEAGAEHYSGSYYNRKLITTYRIPSLVFSAFELILGDDEMDKVFFSGNGDYLMYQYLYDNNFSHDEIVDFKSLIDMSAKISSNISDNDMVKIADYLIKLYKNVKNSNWYDNYKYNFIISELVHNVSMYEGINANDYRFNTIYYSRQIDNSYFIPEEFKDVSYSYNGPLVEGNDFYINVSVFKDENMFVTIQYDFDRMKIVKYDFYPYSLICDIISE